ncbi:MAG: FG-GAP-like repeat-containing protein, partial [Planctomycetota bacterium]
KDAGIAIKGDGKGLAIAIADLNSDHQLDVYVANDTTENFLFINLGAMHFEERAVPSGAALSSDGTVGASMGVALADFDGNGHFDICTTNFENQVYDLFANVGDAGFVSENSSTGLDLFSRAPLGFGVVFSDFDIDGWPDLFVANGHIWDQTSLGPQYEFQMQPTLLQNDAGRRFRDVATLSGDYFQTEWLGRSVAHGDLDNDGDTDLVVMHSDIGPALLRNDRLSTSSGVRLDLVGLTAARTPLGATVKVHYENTAATCFQVPSGGSFQASPAPEIILPADSTGRPVRIEVHWTDGSVSDCPMVERPTRRYRLIQYQQPVPIPSG